MNINLLHTEATSPLYLNRFKKKATSALLLQSIEATCVFTEETFLKSNVVKCNTKYLGAILPIISINLYYFQLLKAVGHNITKL